MIWGKIEDREGVMLANEKAPTRAQSTAQVNAGHE